MREVVDEFPSVRGTKGILIVEDHTILRDGLRAILADYAEFKVVGEAADGIEGICQVKELKPHLVLLDLSMPKMNGIDALMEIKRISPATKVLVLSVNRAENRCRAAIRAGADGYVLKDSGREELIKAIQEVLKGTKFISREMGIDSEDTECPAVILKSDLMTRRERQILKLIAEGHTNKQIGDMLFISPKTVDNHRSNLMRKLSLHNVQDLTRFASRENLLVEK